MRSLKPFFDFEGRERKWVPSGGGAEMGRLAPPPRRPIKFGKLAPSTAPTSAALFTGKGSAVLQPDAPGIGQLHPGGTQVQALGIGGGTSWRAGSAWGRIIV